jgi:hypothetical protein
MFEELVRTFFNKPRINVARKSELAEAIQKDLASSISRSSFDDGSLLIEGRDYLGLQTGSGEILAQSVHLSPRVYRICGS